MQIRVTTWWLMVVLALVLYKLLAVQGNGSSERRGARAKMATAKAQLVNLNAALELYLKDVGHYPTSTLGLTALVGQTSEGKWDGPYMQSGRLPLDPWGNPYRYSLQDGRPSVRSAGPDGVDGTADDLTPSRNLEGAGGTGGIPSERCISK